MGAGAGWRGAGTSWLEGCRGEWSGVLSLYELNGMLNDGEKLYRGPEISHLRNAIVNFKAVRSIESEFQIQLETFCSKFY